MSAKVTTSDLRKLPSFDSLFGADVGGLPRDPCVVEVLEQFWPDCFESTHGGVVMSPEDAARLERLFEMFGVPMKVSQHTLKDLGHAYDVFSISLAGFVSYRLRFPDRFRQWLYDWPQDWVDYIDAVAVQDTRKARELASRLKVATAQCQYPPGILVAGLTSK